MPQVPTAAGVATYVLAITSLAGGLAGCRLIKTTAEIPGNAVRAITPGSKEDKEEVQANPVVLQQDIFRFCDEYSNIISAEYDRLIEDRPGVATSGLVRTTVSSPMMPVPGTSSSSIRPASVGSSWSTDSWRGACSPFDCILFASHEKTNQVLSPKS